MISIIICSANPTFAAAIRNNIAETIGVEHEVILIDNRADNWGISQVYNTAASKAKFNILCFLHEDIILHTEKWGLILKGILDQDNIGLVGGFGAVYKSIYPGTWAACVPGLYRLNDYHRANTVSIETGDSEAIKGFYEVAVIDGAFMATTKEIFIQYKFDEELLKGFHCYDIDYSLSVGSKYKLVVSKNIQMQHISPGYLNCSWLLATRLVHTKWESVLPKSVSHISKNLCKHSDYLALLTLLNTYLKFPGYKYEVFNIFRKVLTKFPFRNRIRYFKTVFKYLISIQ